MTEWEARVAKERQAAAQPRLEVRRVGYAHASLRRGTWAEASLSPTPDPVRLRREAAGGDWPRGREGREVNGGKSVVLGARRPPARGREADGRLERKQLPAALFWAPGAERGREEGR